MKGSHKIGRPAASVFHAVTHVWGREYLDCFLDVCIPNQMSPGNVAALPSGSRYRILTRALHFEELDTHPMVRALRQVLPVDVVVVSREFDPNRGYEFHTACHQRALTDAMDADAAILMLSADFVFSENSLAAVVQRHREGFRAVVNTGLRLAKEPFLEQWRRVRDQRPALSGQELVRLAMPCLHPHTNSMFVDADAFSTFPVAAYWRVGAEGLLARCLHLHPLMVDPINRVPLTGTNDGRYLARAVPDFSKVHVVTDSDELQMFELTPVTRDVIPTTRATSQGMAIWRTAVVAARCDDLQIDYWRRRPVRIHGRPVDGHWTAAEADAQRFARAMLWCCRPFGVPAPGVIAFIERSRQLSEKQWRLMRRRLPRLPIKRITRPVKLARSRVSKTLRKTTRQLTRYVGAHSR